MPFSKHALRQSVSPREKESARGRAASRWRQCEFVKLPLSLKRTLRLMQSLAQPSALMRRFGLFLTLGLLVLAGACTGGRRPRPTAPNPAADGNPAARVEWPGAKADGSVLLPNQWSLHPAGQPVELADFPVNVAIHPRGRFVAILHCGFSEHQIQIVDLKTPSVVSRSNVNEAFYGMEFSKDGEKLYASGAGDEVVHVFDFHEGALS